MKRSASMTIGNYPSGLNRKLFKKDGRRSWKGIILRRQI
jgi:hypothetical protein